MKERKTKITRRHLRCKSHLLRLPQDILEEVDLMITGRGEYRKTYRQIADWLRQKGYRNSKSAVGRYAAYLLSQNSHERQMKEELNDLPVIAKKERLFYLLRRIIRLFDADEIKRG